jgi:hypothetical protein
MPELNDMEEAVNRIGRRPKITDDQIRDEIMHRLSGDPADLVPFRIQRALESICGSEAVRRHQAVTSLVARRFRPHHSTQIRLI